MKKLVTTNILVCLFMTTIILAQAPETGTQFTGLKIPDIADTTHENVKVKLASFPIGSSVFLNDRFLGKTPINFQVSTGTQQLSLWLFGYKRISQEVDFTTDTSIYLVLEKYNTFGSYETQNDDIKFLERVDFPLSGDDFKLPYSENNITRLSNPFEAEFPGSFSQQKSSVRKKADKDFKKFEKKIRHSNANGVNRLIRNNTNIEAKGESGETPLLYAIEKDKIEIAKLLMDAGAEINALDDKKNGVLHYAIKYGIDRKEIYELIDKGAALDKQNSDGNTPLFYSVIYKRPQLTYYLIEYGADISKVTTRNENMLHLAIRVNDEELLKFLLEKDLNIEQNSYFNETPLLLAMRNQNDQMVQDIIHAGAKIKSSYLDDAIWLDYKMVVEQILENGLSRPMNCSSNDACFKTAFTYSVFAGMADEDEQLQLYENALNIFKLANEKYRTDLGKIQAKEAAIVTAIAVAAILTAGAIANSVPSSSSSYPADYKSYQPSYSPPPSYDYSYNYGINSYQPKEQYPSRNNFEYKEKKYLKQQLKLCRVQIREIKKKISELKKNKKQL